MTDLAILTRLEAELARRERENRLKRYRPYAPVARWHALLDKERALIAANQVGKALKHGTMVATPNGWRAIESLRVGDTVIAGDGSQTRVVGVYPQGVVPLYSVSFDGVRDITTCGEHLWLYQHPRSRYPYRQSHGKREPNPFYGVWRVGDTKELSQFGSGPRMRAVVPMAEPFQLRGGKLPIDPYALGVLLGDGCMSQEAVTLTSADPEIAASVGKHFKVTKHKAAYQYGVTGAVGAIRRLGLLGRKSESKFIPEEYLYARAEDRLAMVQGLMDTDGSIAASNGAMEYATCSDALADGFLWLCASLGVKARKERRHTKDQHGNGQPSWRIKIRRGPVCLFRLKRKAIRWAKDAATDNWIVHGVKPAGRGKATCISVDHPSRTYVIEGGIVTHNTFGAGSEVAMHLTGQYPDWWKGRRFDKANVGWVAGVTGEATRDNPQRILLGRPGEWGTGTIPKAAISHVQRAVHRVADAADYVLVRHVSGQLSRAYFKAYDQGREKFQGESLDWGWCDEEPPEDVYIEFLTRLNVSNGPMMMTFTPLLGMSSVVRRFLQEKRPGTAFVSMTIEDAEHYTPEQRQAIADMYPAHEREARTKGIPSLGSGRIFPVTEEMISYDPFQFAPHWPRVAGVDFGGVDHPAAAAFCAIDPESDAV